MHECGVLGTASSALSHCEGNKVPPGYHGFQFKVEGQAALTTQKASHES